ncbi:MULTISPECIES: hypothetical protein [unclassified Bradyrhizobium]|uniref:hypothetical protein n=1 Tax=Bradyrhizobium sp. USDA 4541 TaxID=2817704 RepID=UPI0020A57EE3|nr:hypothetical protein [Bradyrhizobium sp. USDA 4541]MCP1854356.1 hypothetical protein [Bradyrhizobium sp. USDA 4541]
MKKQAAGQFTIVDFAGAAACIYVDYRHLVTNLTGGLGAGRQESATGSFPFTPS